MAGREGQVKLAVVVLCIACIAACAPRPRWQGRGDVLGVYARRTLTAEFPDPIAPPAVVAAAKASMRRWGYTVTEASATRDRGRVEAVLPGSTAGSTVLFGLAEKRVIVTAHLSRLDTRVRVRVEPLGDETLSRAILDGMLAKLGY